MKVLWICNIVLPAIAERLGLEVSHKEGWLAGLSGTILEHRQENQIELHVAYPVGSEQENRDGATLGAEQSVKAHVIQVPEYGDDAVLYGYGFYEDVSHAENYDPGLEQRIGRIIDTVQPDVIHCFGTEYGHTLAAVQASGKKERVLVGIQGLCQVIAGAYMADLPEKVQKSVTFRDWLKKDSIKKQQQKFALRGNREQEILKLAGNVTGRTEFDRFYTKKCNPNANYYFMNETLRSCFYDGQWMRENCEPHTIFVSQGDYPLKGLHYLLLAAGSLQERYPDIRIKIAGNSLVNYRTIKDKIKISAYGKYLRRLLAEQKLEDKVQFLGKLSAEQMKEEYLTAGLFVCCSSNENSPNSLGEAMLLGVPCVAADVGGIPSIFSHGEDGILYQGFGVGRSLEDVVRNLSFAIMRMWDNPGEQEKYSESARKHARITHNKETNYRKMTEIYAEIAGTSER